MRYKNDRPHFGNPKYIVIHLEYFRVTKINICSILGCTQKICIMSDKIATLIVYTSAENDSTVENCILNYSYELSAQFIF